MAWIVVVWISMLSIVVNSPKSARILSAAITRTILLPAGVRGSPDDFHSGVGYVELG